jgi:hypothetical protein
LVGGKVLESRGILKHWTDSNRDEVLGLNYWALKCANQHEYLATSQSGICPECEEGLDVSMLRLYDGSLGAAQISWSEIGSNLEKLLLLRSTA